MQGEEIGTGLVSVTCMGNEESIDRLFLGCIFSGQVWALLRESLLSRIGHLPLSDDVVWSYLFPNTRKLFGICLRRQLSGRFGGREIIEYLIIRPDHLSTSFLLALLLFIIALIFFQADQVGSR